MLFFKDVKDELLTEPGFRSFYDQECHICATTMALVSQVMQMGEEEGRALLDRLGIGLEAFQDLAEGDHCDPAMVAALARALGKARPGMFDACPRSAETSAVNEQEGPNGRQ